MDNTSLESQLQKAFEEVKLGIRSKLSINCRLESLKISDEQTAMHSIRVALKGKEIAKSGVYPITSNPKIMLFGGCLHDVGKTSINTELLKKDKNFSSKDMEEMRKHPIEGYELLKNNNYFSAIICLYHHYFSKDSYPSDSEIMKLEMKLGAKGLNLAKEYAKVIGVIDDYDAMSRKNDKFSPGKPEILSAARRKEKLLENHPQSMALINKLYAKSIFS